MRKQKLIQFLNLPKKNEESLEFIDSYIKYYCSNIISSIKTKENINDYNNLLASAEYQQCEKQQIILSNIISNNMKIYIIISGIFRLKSNNNEKIYEKGQYILILDSNNDLLTLECIESGDLLTLDKTLYKQILTKQSYYFYKLTTLNKTFKKFKNSENKELLLTYFNESELQQFGNILTTPTSGSKDLFIILKGKILIFVPNRYNQNYKKPFIVLNVCKENCTFNESHLLYENDEYYGSMVVQENTQLLKLAKNNLGQVSDQDTLDIQRDIHQAKNRLYKAQLNKIQNLNHDQVYQQQINFVSAFDLDFNKIEEQFQKYMINNIIYTTESFTKKKENMQKFHSKIGKNAISYKPQGQVEQVGNQQPNIICGTNRIVARELNKGMTATQQLALKNLQNAGKSRRSGDIQNADVLKDLSLIEVQKYKNNMLNAIKEEDTDLFKGYRLVKKGIGEKQLQNSTPDGTPLNTDRKKKIQQCLIPGISSKTIEDQEQTVIKFENKTDESFVLQSKIDPIKVVNLARKSLSLLAEN